MALPLRKLRMFGSVRKCLAQLLKLWPAYGQRPWFQGAVGDKVQETELSTGCTAWNAVPRRSVQTGNLGLKVGETSLWLSRFSLPPTSSQDIGLNVYVRRDNWQIGVTALEGNRVQGLCVCFSTVCSRWSDAPSVPPNPS